MGAVIGHEIMHGFDNEGVLFDENGNHRRSWLPDEFYNQFHERTSCLVKIYNDSEPSIEDLKVDGIKTLSENIADNEGVKLALKVVLVSCPVLVSLHFCGALLSVTKFVQPVLKERKGGYSTPIISLGCLKTHNRSTDLMKVRLQNQGF
ncbi:hypothetical protein Y032_0018g3704 [Ancylostoma ceylanicum]|uniref:Peptidase M13 C-terminal domain-containing protein n=1 Tax=Ancylostoma ceylanicum TaxID=53326 RepID=A0A016V5V8_9BILA|nr:hypothetical protein Y032_0018g3704 [Ancylostoma ceylanicum]